MNEQMNQLQTEAARYAKEKYPSDIVKWSLCMSEKFAELIVKECASKVDNILRERKDGGGTMGDEIREHFGVEE